VCSGGLVERKAGGPIGRVAGKRGPAPAREEPGLVLILGGLPGYYRLKFVGGDGITVLVSNLPPILDGDSALGFEPRLGAGLCGENLEALAVLVDDPDAGVGDEPVS